MTDAERHAMTGAQRMAKMRAARRAAGLVNVGLWLGPDVRQQFEDFQRQHGLTPEAALAHLLSTTSKERP